MNVKQWEREAWMGVTLWAFREEMRWPGLGRGHRHERSGQVSEQCRGQSSPQGLIINYRERAGVAEASSRRTLGFCLIDGGSILRDMGNTKGTSDVGMGRPG